MNNELFMKIISLILTIIAGLISAYVIPWIKTKFTQNQLDQLMKYAEIAVRCAEQIYKTEEYSQKKQYVLDYLVNVIKTKLKIEITTEDLDNLIESTVNQVKYSGEYSR